MAAFRTVAPVAAFRMTFASVFRRTSCRWITVSHGSIRQSFLAAVRNGALILLGFVGRRRASFSFEAVTGSIGLTGLAGRRLGLNESDLLSVAPPAGGADLLRSFFSVEFLQVFDGELVALFGRLRQVKPGFNQVLRHASADQKHHAEYALRLGMPEVGRLGEPLGGDLVIAGQAPSFVGSFPEFVVGFGVALQSLFPRSFRMLLLDPGRKGSRAVDPALGLEQGGFEGQPGARH